MLKVARSYSGDGRISARGPPAAATVAEWGATRENPRERPLSTPAKRPAAEDTSDARHGRWRGKAVGPLVGPLGRLGGDLPPQPGWTRRRPIPISRRAAANCLPGPVHRGTQPSAGAAVLSSPFSDMPGTIMSDETAVKRARRTIISMTVTT